MSDQPQAAWYADPQNPAQQRYWDGSQWTEHVAPIAPPPPPAAAPTPGPEVAEPAHAGQAETGSASTEPEELLVPGETNDRKLARQQRAQEKADEKAREAQEREEAEARKSWEESPLGKATAAHEAGNGFFQIELSVTAINRKWGGTYGNAGYNTKLAGRSDHSDALSQIESAGWHLEHVSHVWMVTGSQSRDKLFTSGQDVGMTGELLGIYLFRRAASDGPAAGESEPVPSS